MIIQIRGTSGSGKSWTMKSLLGKLGPFTEHFIKKRKQPLFYYNKSGVVILGHYASPCGGCDTIGSAAAVATLIKELEEGVYTIIPTVIICEGLLLSEDSKWTSQMKDVRIIYLTTPVDQCVTQIIQRRAAVGNEKPLNESNTRKRVSVIERSRKKLIEKGVHCVRCSSYQAPGIIERWVNDATAMH